MHCGVHRGEGIRQNRVHAAIHVRQLTGRRCENMWARPPLPHAAIDADPSLRMPEVVPSMRLSSSRSIACNYRSIGRLNAACRRQSVGDRRSSCHARITTHHHRHIACRRQLTGKCHISRSVRNSCQRRAACHRNLPRNLRSTRRRSYRRRYRSTCRDHAASRRHNSGSLCTPRSTYNTCRRHAA